MSSKIDLAAITINDLVTLLAKVGSTRASKELIENHINQGAPVNENGTINLINYTAWLVKEYQT